MTGSHARQDEPVVVSVAPGVRRVRAPNPSAMTERGTNTYLVGAQALAVIDPGPALAAHLDRLLAEIGTTPVVAILVTHSHLDHSALAPELSRHTGAPVLAFGASDAGRRPEMEQMSSNIGGGEGVDTNFRPDRCMAEGDVVVGDDWALTALWTPGHMANHLCFAFGDLLFTGDLVMGWSTSLVSPPDGDLTSFMASCQKLSTRSDSLYLPGHGDPVRDPSDRLAGLVAHRLARTDQLRAALAEGPGTPAALTARVYHDVAKHLLPAAERNLLAHLLALVEAGEVGSEDPPGRGAVFFSRATPGQV